MGEFEEYKDYVTIRDIGGNRLMSPLTLWKDGRICYMKRGTRKWGQLRKINDNGVARVQMYFKDAEPMKLTLAGIIANAFLGYLPSKHNIEVSGDTMNPKLENIKISMK